MHACFCNAVLLACSVMTVSFWYLSKQRASELVVLAADIFDCNPMEALKGGPTIKEVSPTPAMLPHF